MKEGLISINKPFTGNILDGIKKIEWRKSALPQIRFFIYETKNKGGCGKVVGEMRITANRRINLPGDTLRKGFIESGCVPYSDLEKYAGESGILWANIIGEVKRYDKPKELSEFYPIKPKRIEDWTNKDDCAYCKYHKWVGSMQEYVEKGKPMREKCTLGKPEPICEYTPPISRPPQSWCYVEVKR